MSYKTLKEVYPELLETKASENPTVSRNGKVWEVGELTKREEFFIELGKRQMYNNVRKLGIENCQDVLLELKKEGIELETQDILNKRLQTLKELFDVTDEQLKYG